jgi:hypothetical protein
MSVSSSLRIYHEYVDQYKCTSRIPLEPTYEANLCIRASDSVIKYNMHHALMSHKNVIIACERDAIERETVCFPIQTKDKCVTQVFADASYEVAMCYTKLSLLLTSAVEKFENQSQ